MTEELWSSSRFASPPDIKQSAYVTELASDNRRASTDRPSVPHGSNSSQDVRREVLSESEEEIPHDDPFLFRHMGRKVKERIKKLSDSIFARREDTSLMANLEEGDFPTRELSSDRLSIAMHSAVRVPAYELGQRRDGFFSVPIILGLLKISLVDDVGMDRKMSSINYVFKIHLEYSESCNWTINRRIYDIFRLHMILTFKNVQSRMNWSLPHFPNQFAYLFDTSALKSMNREDRRAHKRKLIRERRDELELYLRNLFQALNMQPNTAELFEFLEISHLSVQLLAHETGEKLKEGYLKNRLFETKQSPRWYSFLLCNILDRKEYRTKWFIARSSYIAFVDRIDQTSPSDILLCDKDFHTIVENEHSGLDQLQFLKPLTITIVNSSKKLEVRPESNSQIDFWLETFRKLAVDCIWCHPHRFGSFAPVRYHCQLDWLIDAEEYYNNLIRTIEGAKEEIYLHGWWISPELYLLRPSSSHPQMRLDRILQRKAIEGVKIYILVFKEFSMALALNSYHTKSSLERLHPNIRVQRHPDHFGGILYWAHHEKIVVIDQSIAFTGGLDLCFGRYDTQLHSLTDTTTAQVWTGLDYSNPRIRDFRNVIQHTNAMVDRSTVPRMPWHDVHMKVYGAPARDLGRHFIERWNFVKAKKAMHKDQHIPFLLPRPEYSIVNSFQGTMVVQAVRSVAEWSLGTAPETSIYDAYLHYIENARHFIYIENQFFVSRSAEKQTTPIRNRIAQAIVERIIRADNDGEPFKVIVILPLLPAFEAPLHRSEASSLRMIMQGQYSGISRGPSSLLGRLVSHGIKAEQYISFFSLRKYSFLEEKAITEQVYVHSKVMIVDDQVALVGSANINDRSMLGMRDSEINLIIEDKEQVPAILNGKSVTVSRKVRELRTRLFQEHLGLLELPFTDHLVTLLQDPTTDEFYYGLLRKQASRNTQIFRELFHCVPDDCVDTWEEYRRFTETPRIHVIDEVLGINSLEMLNSIKGNIVMFPTQFLRKEDLAASLLSIESLLPVEVYL